MMHEEHCPNVFLNKKMELRWYEEAQEALKRRGLLPCGTETERLISECRCIALSMIYLDFIAQSDRVYNTYDVLLRGSMPDKEKLTARMRQKFGDAVDEAIGGREMLKRLAGSERDTVAKALREEWGDNLFFSSIYCMWHLPCRAIKKRRKHYERKIENAFRKFAEYYWEYVSSNCDDLAEHALTFTDAINAKRAYKWVGNGCRRVEGNTRFSMLAKYHNENAKPDTKPRRMWIGLRDMQRLEYIANEAITAEKAMEEYKEAGKQIAFYLYKACAHDAAFSLRNIYGIASRLSNEFIIRDKGHLAEAIMFVSAPFSTIDLIIGSNDNNMQMWKAQRAVPKMMKLMQEIMDEAGLPIFDRMKAEEIKAFYEKHERPHCKHPSKKKIERIRAAMAEVMEPGKAKRAYLYGSCARGTDKRGSDIDIEVEWDESVRFDYVQKMEKKLTKILKQKVYLAHYVTDDNPLCTIFCREIKKDEILIYEDKTMKEATQQ